MSNPFKHVMKLVNKQAEDEGLWFITQTVGEAYLQKELRKLHYSVEMADKEPYLSLDEVINSMKELEGWLDNESFGLGAVDGYDYNSGVEYGLRLASIETKKRIKALQQKFGD